MNFFLKTTDLILSASEDKIQFIVIDVGSVSYSFRVVTGLLPNNPDCSKKAHSPTCTHSYPRNLSIRSVSNIISVQPLVLATSEALSVLMP